MMKILVTGKNSFVGNAFKEWLDNYAAQYLIDKISMKEDKWKNYDFSTYDSLLHVAGIAHVSTDPKMKETYLEINRDLTIEVAKKAKKAGIKQFIFMSSIIVYGNRQNVIDDKTIPQPSNFYGKSKLQAEEGLKSLESSDFKIAIIRPPMIYGKGSKGNYPKLAKAARVLPVFPNIDNHRSMIHIDNLSEFIRLIIKNKENGLFFPQNEHYVRTSEMVSLIAKTHGKKIRLTKLFNPIIKTLTRKVHLFDKVFGNLIYEKQLSEYKEFYQVRNLEESIRKTELESK